MICRNEDYLHWPKPRDDLDAAQFVIYRYYETDLSTSRQDGRYKNLDKSGRKKLVMSWYWFLDYREEDETNFSDFSDAPARKYLYMSIGAITMWWWYCRNPRMCGLTI